ncbi:MAG: bifunctional adenosylcobinamide kinase/adenosylcobinamide-phosphate guanylyltransferase [Granulosicoccus sp.]
MKTLILGGIKSGKSRLAEKLAQDLGVPVTLVATATADDDEMKNRIRKHQRSRPDNWNTIEEPVAIAAVLEQLSGNTSCVVLDCLTLWLTNLLMLSDHGKLEHETSNFLIAAQAFPGTLIIVSNETSMGIVPVGDLTRRFCDESGLLHQALADLCESVILCVAGLPHSIKGNIITTDALN